MNEDIKCCKLCQQKIEFNGSFIYTNKNGKVDVCNNCGDYMKYLDKDLVKDKVKFIRKIRCDNCNFRICKINDKPTCLWCLNDDIILRHKVLYGIYKFKTHAFVLQNDFNYCINQLNFRKERNYDDTKLTQLTNKILNNVSQKNRYSKEELGSINSRW